MLRVIKDVPFSVPVPTMSVGHRGLNELLQLFREINEDEVQVPSSIEVGIRCVDAKHVMISIFSK